MDWSEPKPMPKCDTSPNVGLWPMIPQNAAGMRMEAPWSPPREMSHWRADAAARLPPELDVHVPSGHGSTGARRRSAGHVLPVVRIQRTAVVADAAAGPAAAAPPVHHVLPAAGTARLP